MDGIHFQGNIYLQKNSRCLQAGDSKEHLFCCQIQAGFNLNTRFYILEKKMYATFYSWSQNTFDMCTSNSANSVTVSSKQ